MSCAPRSFPSSTRSTAAPPTASPPRRTRPRSAPTSSRSARRRERSRSCSVSETVMVRFVGAVLLALAPSLAHAQPAGDSLRAKAPRPPIALEHRSDPWSGDFDGMVERRLVRILVPYSRTLYFNDKGAQRGLTAAAVRDFERFLADKFKLRGRPITVVAMPTTRDQLLAGLAEGRGDIAAGNITITASRDALVDFSYPLAEGVAEIVVTGPASPRISSLEDLSGREVHVRKSSSYYESLSALNR